MSIFGIKKRKIQVWSVIISGCLLVACSSAETKEQKNVTGIEFTGETQGTTYHIIIAEDSSTLTTESIDSLLAKFDQSLSTYIPTSVISRLNASMDTSIIDPSGFFQSCFTQSYEVFHATNGAFDPSVHPLFKGWGFLSEEKEPLNQSEVDELLQIVGFDRHHRVLFSGDTILWKKEKEAYAWNFNAIAQGMAVDELEKLVKKAGHTDYYIEIGGELIVRGTNREGEAWKIGIDTPVEHPEKRVLENVIHVPDGAIATSGNYRNFYEKDGKKYAHTIDPKTGYPVQHSLLSATVIAPQCAQADAYATAFLVMGTEKTLEFVRNHASEELEVYLLQADENGEIERVMSDGFDRFLTND